MNPAHAVAHSERLTTFTENTLHSVETRRPAFGPFNAPSTWQVVNNLKHYKLVDALDDVAAQRLRNPDRQYRVHSVTHAYREVTA
jgi:hypothetical protein